jgi:hypothetical protein
MKAPILSSSFGKLLLQHLNFDPDFYEVSSLSEESVKITLKNFYYDKGEISNLEI